MKFEKWIGELEEGDGGGGREKIIQGKENSIFKSADVVGRDSAQKMKNIFV